MARRQRVWQHDKANTFGGDQVPGGLQIGTEWYYM